jgi:hypothetical protein
MAKITLPNGVTISDVSEAVLRSLIAGLEDGIHYNSATHGKLRIDGMATPHLKNAIAKNLKESLEKVRKTDTQNFINYLTRGVGTESLTTIAMVKELAGRRD